MRAVLAAVVTIACVSSGTGIAVAAQRVLAAPTAEQRHDKPRPAVVKRAAPGRSPALAKLPAALAAPATTAGQAAPATTAGPAKPTDPTTRNVTRLRGANRTSTPAVLASERAGGRPATTAQAQRGALAATAGPASIGFSSVTISPDLNCTATVDAYTAHPSVFYGGNACATIVVIDGIPYGPASIPAGPSLSAWTPVSQSTTGSGTAADPYTITTRVTAAGTGVDVVQQDVYVPGTAYWTTTVTVNNTGSAAVNRVTHARDCYVAESDVGVGMAFPDSAITYCEGISAALGLQAASPGSTWMEAFYGTVWQYASAGVDMPGTYVGDAVDNGQGVTWALDPHAASQSRGWASTLLGGPSASVAGGAPNPSVPQTGCSSSRPVNCATGDFWHSFTDVSVPARGLPLALSRTYDLLNAQVDGRMGYGWHDSLDMRLTRSADRADVVQENGSIVTFLAQADGTWAAPPHVLADLTCTAAGACTFTRPETGMRYGFTADGRLDTVRDTAGEALQLSYDAGGHLTAIAEGGAGRLTFAWTGDHLTGVTDPAGRTTAYAYSAGGDLVSATQPGGARWTFAYDGGHHLVTMSDPRGNTTVNTFDAAFRVVSQKQPTGGVLTFQYAGDPATPTGSTTTTVDERGVRTVYTYANMLMTSKSVTAAGFGDDTFYTYDVVTMRLVAVTEGGQRHQSRYDTLGRLVASVDASGNTTAYTYDGSSFRRTSVTTPMGVTTTATYDGLGRITAATPGDGVTTSYQYADPQHPADVTSSVTAGRTTAFRYDALGDLTHSQVSDATTTVVLADAAYDPSGVAYCTVAPAQYAAGARCPAQGGTAAGTTTTVLDAAGRPAARTAPNGGTTRYAYDGNGNPVTVTDPLGRVTTMTYDAANRVTTVARAAGTPSASTVTTRYDLPPGTAGCPDTGETAYCQATGDGKRTTVEGFNANGDVASFTRPGGKTRTYTHVGRQVVGQTLDDGGTITYNHDGDRLSAITYSDGSTANVAFGYNTDGDKVTMGDGTGQTSYEYDAAGRLTAVTTPNGTVRAGFDSSGQLATVTYPGGEQVHREYDVAGRLVAVTDWSSRRTSFRLDDNGAVTATALPNGRTIQSTYDNQGALTARTVSGTPLALGVTRDALGRATTATETGFGGPASTALTYDPLGQLATTGATATGSDTAGSPTSVNGVPQTFDPALALTGRATAPEPTTVTTSARGERSGQTAANGTRIGYAYDQESRLTELWSIAGPRLTGLSATGGASTGGNTVTITGAGFLPGAQVSFGSRAAATTVVSATSLTAVVPAGSGTVDVTVSTLVGRSVAVTAGRYTYQKPAVTSLSPTSGLAVGGQAVVIRGWNFTGVTAVRFGTRSARFTVNSTEQITATTPAGTGTVAVTVLNGQGTSATGPTYRYHAEPIVTSVSPPAGKTTGGNTVTIRGSNMTGVTRVTFGGRAATKVHVASSTTVTAVAPAGSGAVHVVATSPSGSSAAGSADTYGYTRGPAVYSIGPTTAGVAGGATVTVNGTGFTRTSTIKVGSRTGTRTYVSTTQLKVKVPAGTGTAHVVVANGTIASPQIPKDVLTYVRPAVTGLSLNRGPAGGGQRITVTGSRFTGATKVLFGSAAGTSLTVASSTSLSVTAPAGTSTVDVTVVTPEGTSLTGTADRYTYTTAPIVAALGTRILRAGGGDRVTLTGWNLSDVTEVAFGGTHVPVDSTTATSVVAPSPAGSGVVTVTAYAGTVASVSAAPQQAAYGQVDEHYVYDGAGLRTSTVATDGTITPVVWDPFAGQPAMLVEGGTRLVNGPDDLPVEQADAGNEPRYYVADDKGSTRALLDSAGGVAATLAYTPYGQITARTGILPAVTYAGAVQDATGLLYLINRYLDPTTGTFLTVDPALDVTGQPYAYAAGDPVNATDRQGLWAIIAIGAIVGAVGGAIGGAIDYYSDPDRDHRSLGAAIAGGAIGGGLTGACMGAGGFWAGFAGSTACGALGGMLGSAVEQAIHPTPDPIGHIATGGIEGAIGGAVGWSVDRVVGLSAAKGAIEAANARWGGLKPINLIRPGAITQGFYRSSAVGLVLGQEVKAGLGALGLYRYLYCTS